MLAYQLSLQAEIQGSKNQLHCGCNCILLYLTFGAIALQV